MKYENSVRRKQQNSISILLIHNIWSWNDPLNRLRQLLDPIQQTATFYNFDFGPAKVLCKVWKYVILQVYRSLQCLNYCLRITVFLSTPFLIDQLTSRLLNSFFFILRTHFGMTCIEKSKEDRRRRFVDVCHTLLSLSTENGTTYWGMAMNGNEIVHWYQYINNILISVLLWVISILLWVIIILI